MGTRKKVIRLGGALLFQTFAVVRALLPNPVFSGGNRILEWGFTDNRLATGLYLSVFLSVAVFGLLTCSPAPIPERSFTIETQARRYFGGLFRTFIGGASGAALLTPYVIGQLRPNVHLDVQLGGLQSIHSGGTPFIDSITQYAPGMQWLLFRLTESNGFSYSGALRAQTILNSITLVAFAGIAFWFLGWIRGVLTVSALCVLFGPLQYVVSMAGWGIMLRWCGVVLVSFLAASAASSFVGKRRNLLLKFVAVGMVWGLAAVVAQEALMAGGVAIALCLGISTATRLLKSRLAFEAVVATGIGFIVTWLTVVTSIVGFPNLNAAVRLYVRYPLYVSNGVSSKVFTHALTAGISIVKIVLVGLPILLVLVVALLSSGQVTVTDHSRASIRRLIGVVSGAAALSVGMYFQISNIHAEGPTVLLGAFLVVCVFDLPRVMRTERQRDGAFVVSGALVGSFVALNLLSPLTYASSAPFARNLITSRRDMAQWFNRTDISSRAASVRALRTDGRYSPSDFDQVFKRFTGTDEYNQLFDHEIVEELLQRAAVVRSLAIGREVLFVDSRSGERFGMGPTPSGVTVFLADLKTDSPYVEPAISVWTTNDQKRRIDSIRSSHAQCVITDSTPSQSVEVSTFVQTFKAVEERSVDVGSDTIRSYCRNLTAPRSG